ncbi:MULTISPECIES: erythromycin esterase family protein [unclassified Kribbella]|uniref:erythromycin esterase family protein n=1 Tax=unclassified Kribbella TaxID=2644121 RepID=UPI0033F22F4E
MTAGIERAASTVDSASVMALLPGKPRLLGLGEPTHGEEVLLELRNELFQQLVEQEGYRTFALESDCLMGLVVDDYVRSGRGTLDDVMERGFSHEWGAFPANRELVNWMRSYNDGRPADEQLRFAGFDGPLEITAAASPRQALTGLHAYLAAWGDTDLLPCTADALDRLLGPDDQWTNLAAMRDPSQSVGQTAEAKELRLLADDLVALLNAQAPQLIEASAPNDWERALLYARTARGLLRYHRWMADTSPSRLAWLLAVRDSMMAANLLAIADRGPALVSAHNAHLQRNKSSMRLGDQTPQWWSAGALVSAQLGKDYAHLATALGTIPHQGVTTPPPNTLEGLLYTLPGDTYLLDPAALHDLTPVPRVSPWYGYAPLDPAHLPTTDAILFVKHAHRT